MEETEAPQHATEKERVGDGGGASRIPVLSRELSCPLPEATTRGPVWISLSRSLSPPFARLWLPDSRL